jgi:hypothetical protein
LARRFGVQRSSGGRSQSAVKPEPPFYLSLKAIVERAQARNQPIPFTSSTLLLKNAGAAEREVCELMRRLIPDIDQASLSELVEICNRTIAHRAEQSNDAPA